MNSINTPISNSDSSKTKNKILIKTTDSPLHVQVSDVLREKVYSRKWCSGIQIPSEHELMDVFGVSRGTIRRAIKTLVDEGILVQEHGIGTFVAKRGISHPAGVRPLSFAESFRNQGKEFITKVIKKEVKLASQDIATALHLNVGDPVMFLQRVRIVDGLPVICQESWNNLVECPGLDKTDFEKESLFNAVQITSKRKVAMANIRYSARVAGKEHGKLLEIDESSPALILEQQIFLEDESVVEWSFTWLKAGQEVVGTAIQA